MSKITKFKVQIISNENNRNQFIENNKIYQTNFTRKNNRLKNNEKKKKGKHCMENNFFKIIKSQVSVKKSLHDNGQNFRKIT